MGYTVELDFIFHVRIDDRHCGRRGRVPISVINGNPLQPISAAETERYKLWFAEKNKATNTNFYLMSEPKVKFTKKILYI